MYDLLALIGAIAVSSMALVSSVFMNVRHSRCTSIDCCGVHCTRQVMTSEEMQKDRENNNNFLEMMKNPMANATRAEL